MIRRHISIELQVGVIAIAPGGEKERPLVRVSEHLLSKNAIDHLEAVFSEAIADLRHELEKRDANV